MTQKLYPAPRGRLRRRTRRPLFRTTALCPTENRTAATNYWQSIGFGSDDERILAFAQIDEQNQHHVEFACWDEAYAVISPDFLDSRGEAPSGFDLDPLKSDLAQVTSH